MALCAAAVIALALWDEQREASEALADFGNEQATLALATAHAVRARLEEVRRDADACIAEVSRGGAIPPSIAARYARIRVLQSGEAAGAEPPPPGELRVTVRAAQRTLEFWFSPDRILGATERLDRPDVLAVFVRPAGETAFRNADGATVVSSSLIDGARRGRRWVRLGRSEAAALGLPARTAFAGIASADVDGLGQWTVAVAASALRERDREQRAIQRFLLATLLVLAVVSVFAGVALRNQRKELRLEQKLAVSAIEADRDAQLQREARAAMMLVLAAGVAHEVSTPLGVIVGRAEQIAERATQDERIARNVALILEQSERIREIIRGLLRLARGGSPILEPLSPSDWLRAAAVLVEHRFARADVVLTVDVADEVPEIRGDRRLLEHALANLLLNACDASAPGDRVELSAKLEDGRVRVVVADQGRGIPPELAERVMQPGFSTKGSDEGTGVGLAIAHEIVSLHRGTLSLEPRTPRGTLAAIEVPAA